MTVIHSGCATVLDGTWGVISLNMHTMNWQHGYVYTQILSVVTTGALAGPYGTNAAKDGHETANSNISSTVVSRHLLPRPTAR